MGKKGKAGGKPKGRAGQKQKAQRQSNNSWADFGDDDDNSGRMFKGFSQKGAGPSNGFSPRTPTVRLRHQAISFVSASPSGQATPMEDAPEPLLTVGEDGQEDHEEDDEDEAEDGNEEEEDDDAMQTNIVIDTDMEISEGAMSRMRLQGSSESTSLVTQHTSERESFTEQNAPQLPVSKAPLFFVDTVGNEKLQASHKSSGKRPVARAPSPSPSDSSDEVVFHGRNKSAVTEQLSQKPTGRQKAQPPHIKRSQPDAQGAVPHVTDSLLAALDAPSSFSQISSPAPVARGWAANPAEWEKQVKPQEAWTPAPTKPYWREPEKCPTPPPAEEWSTPDLPVRQSKVAFVPAQAPDREKDAEDTINSLLAKAEWKSTLQAKRAAKDATRGVVGSTDDVDSKASSNRRGKRGRKKSNRALRAEALLTDEDEEAEDDAAEQDYVDNLKAQLEAEDPSGSIMAVLESGNVLTPSEAVSGPSMVIDGKGYDEDELLKLQQVSDEWEDESSTGSEVIGQDLDELPDYDGPSLSDSELDSSELEEALEYTEREQWEDEADLRERRKQNMSDETMARLLAKQIELGIDDDDLVIDDGDYGDLDEARLRLPDITNSSFARSTRKPISRRRRGQGDSFPDASALADTVEQYGENGFDIMDFERPSLRPTKKGRKGKLPAELEAVSDEDLRDTLNHAWENDRAAKRSKKAEREELRQQGLLGSSGKKGKADLSQKYLQGMTTKQIHDELRIFLMDDGQQSRPFPPMGKDDRKALHQVADALDLKSKSVGSGKNRFPVLYKTSFTLEYDEYAFNKAITKSARGFYKNAAYKGSGSGKKAMKKAGAGAGGGFSKSAVSVRHGEVVGANAKEIGADSFGHKMMEKMGWTKGTALGKDGEGLLVPVAQVMRSGKAGLG